MRKVISTTFVTLDGVMQAPGGPDEDRSDGFEYGGWSVNYWADDAGAFMDKILGDSFDLLLGRKTYEIFAGYWPTAPEEAVGAPFNKATKYVASRTLKSLEWGPSVLLEGDAADAVAKLKETDGPELQVHGSGDFLQTLLRHNLIDRMYVWTLPVLIGSGKKLFAEGTVPSALKLVDSTVTSKGAVIGTYEPAGALEVGTF